MTVKGNQTRTEKLLLASEKVLKLAEARRARMQGRAASASTKVKAEDEAPPAPPVEEEEKDEEDDEDEEEAALPEEEEKPAEEAPPVAAKVAAKKVKAAKTKAAAVKACDMPAAEAALPEAISEEEKDEEDEEEAALPEEEEKPAEEAPPVAAKVAAKKVKAAPDATGSSDLAPAKKEDAGEEDLGLHIPPELAKVVEDGKDESDDGSFSPGILIPPGLEDAVMAVADPEALPEEGEVRLDMVPFVPEEATTAAEIVLAGAHWVLFANGEPLAKVSLKDQPHADRIAAHFVSKDYARAVVEGVQKHGLTETLKTINAKAYVAVIDKNKAIEAAKTKLAASAEEGLRQKVAGIKAKYTENLGLVLEASASNFIVENPLKDALVSAVAGLGIPESVASGLVDDAFFQHGVKTLASLLDQAEAWANTPAEAMNAIKAAMQQAGRRARPLPSDTPAAKNPNYDHQAAARMSAAVVPAAAPSEQSVSASARIHTQGATSDDAKSAYRSRFGGFGRR